MIPFPYPGKKLLRSWWAVQAARSRWGTIRGWEQKWEQAMGAKPKRLFFSIYHIKSFYIYREVLCSQEAVRITRNGLIMRFFDDAICRMLGTNMGTELEQTWEQRPFFWIRMSSPLFVKNRIIACSHLFVPNSFPAAVLARRGRCKIPPSLIPRLPPKVAQECATAAPRSRKKDQPVP